MDSGFENNAGEFLNLMQWDTDRVEPCSYCQRQINQWFEMGMDLKLQPKFYNSKLFIFRLFKSLPKSLSVSRPFPSPWEKEVSFPCLLHFTFLAVANQIHSRLESSLTTHALVSPAWIYLLMNNRADVAGHRLWRVTNGHPCLWNHSQF